MENRFSTEPFYHSYILEKQLCGVSQECKPPEVHSGTTTTLKGSGSKLVFHHHIPACDQKISYPSIVDGRKTTFTVGNFGLGFSQYTDNETHAVVMQFWFDQATVVKEPYAAPYENRI